MRSTLKNTARVWLTLAALWLSACGGGDPEAPGSSGGLSVGSGSLTGSGPVAGPSGSAPPDASTQLAWVAAGGLAPAPYHWVASDATGTVLAATTITDAGGQVFVSRDGGASFAPAALPPGNWISLDMTPTGGQMVAVQLGGGLYRSADSGTTWERIDTAANPTGALEYESVTISGDGSRVVAAVREGPILVSGNADQPTPTFVRATAAGGGALTDSFRAVDSSADGRTVVAASHNGTLYISADGGTSFERLPVTVADPSSPTPATTEVTNGWYRLALSDDGTRLAVAGSSEFGIGVFETSRSTGLYLGELSGGTWTWRQASAVAGAYTSVAMSGDARVIAATLSSVAGGPGQLLLSTDGGDTFEPVTTPPGETNWRALALDAAGSRAILASGTFLRADGQVYLSSGSLGGAGATGNASAAGGAGTATDAATGTGSGTGAGIDTATGSAIDTGADAAVDAGTGSGFDTGTGAGLETGTGPGVDTGTGAGIDTGTGAGIVPGTGAGSIGSFTGTFTGTITGTFTFTSSAGTGATVTGTGTNVAGEGTGTGTATGTTATNGAATGTDTATGAATSGTSATATGTSANGTDTGSLSAGLSGTTTGITGAPRATTGTGAIPTGAIGTGAIPTGSVGSFSTRLRP